MKLRFAFFLTLLPFLAGSLACADSSTFSEAEAREAFASYIRQNSDGKITVVSFKKTDGQKSEFSGIQMYQLNFEAQIEFGATGSWLKGLPSDMKLSFELIPGRAKQGSWANFGNQLQGGVPVTQGGHATIVGRMDGQKTENGWRISVGDNRLVSQSTPGAAIPNTTGSVESNDVTMSPALRNEMEHAIARAFFRFVTNQSQGAMHSVRFYPKLKEVVSETNCRLTYRAEMEFRADGTWLTTGRSPRLLSFRFTNDLNPTPASGHEQVHAGERAQISGELFAMKRATGWGFILHTGRIDWMNQPEVSHADPNDLAAENACILNLRLIDSAKQQWALGERKGPQDVPAWKDLLPYLPGGLHPDPLTCPAGGTYTLNSMGEKPTCTIPGHVMP